MLDRPRRVHAVLAAAMADPALIERWRRDPAALREIGIELGELALDKIRHFAGLATKVRHNDLRLEVPKTLKLLDLMGMSIELFAAYAGPAAVLREAGKKSKSDRLRSLVSFLDGWLDRSKPAHALAWDMLRHETAILTLRETPVVGRSVRVRSRRASAGSVPYHRGLLIHHEMNCNPAELEAALAGGACAVAALPRSSHHLAY